jgi:D-alanyl-D-alanine carboxypeptidase
VSSAERDGMDVVSVVLNCPDMYERSSKLLNDSFNNYKLVKIDDNKVFVCGKFLGKFNDGEYAVIKKDSKIRYEVIEKDTKKYKVKRGDVIGEVKIYSENNLIFCKKLYSI